MQTDFLTPGIIRAFKRCEEIKFVMLVRDFKFNFGCISHNSCPVCMVCYNANDNGKEPLFYIRSSKYMCSRLLTNKPGPRLVVQKVESDLYSVDNEIGFPITYPLDSNLYSGWHCIQLLNNPGLRFTRCTHLTLLPPPVP